MQRRPIGPSLTSRSSDHAEPAAPCAHHRRVRIPSPVGEHVVGFTATQIPFIEDRTYPAELAGSRYPDGIPIFLESELDRVLHDLRVDDVVFAYSDVSHAFVMHRASQILAAGASFTLLGP